MWSGTSAQNKETLEQLCPGLPALVGEVILQQTKNRLIDQVKQRHAQNPQAVFGVTDHNFGILSLSEVATDIRMWGHYADGGRGFLIEFDPKHSWFHAKMADNDSFRHLRQVKYVSSRPATYLLATNEDQFLYTKWDAWKDEKEWRIIRNFNDHSKKLDFLDPYGNEVLLFDIPPDAIVSVVAGFSSSKQTQESLKQTLADNHLLEHVTTKFANQSEETGIITF